VHVHVHVHMCHTQPGLRTVAGVPLSATLSQPANGGGGGGGGGALVVVAPPAKGATNDATTADEATDEANGAAAHFLSAFFNTLTVDLDGCELSFRALRLQPAGAAGARGGAVAAAGGELELQLELGVCVRRFPSPFVKF
jgi:hypothetical protein